jgi:hypothetical protein
MQRVIKHWSIESKVADFLSNTPGVRKMTCPETSHKMKLRYSSEVTEQLKKREVFAENIMIVGDVPDMGSHENP